MTRTNSPQGKEEAPKKVKLRVKFTCEKDQPSYSEARKDLLVACWNNGKMADLLYHFLYMGSKKANEQHITEDARVFVLYENQSDILAKVKISKPTLIAFLKCFAQAGYVNKAAPKGAYAVHFQTVQEAFVKPPVKPVQEKKFTSNFTQDESKVNHQENESISLRQEVGELRSQVQDLTLTLLSFNSLRAQLDELLNFDFTQTLRKVNELEAALEAVGSQFTLRKALYLNESSEQASQAVSSGQEDSLNLLDIRGIDIRDKESKKDDCANAPHLPTFFTLLPWLWSNDLETPSKLFVELTPTFSANEVQRRLWATEQYKQELAAKGCFVVVEMVSETPQNAIDASALPDWLNAIVDAGLPETQPQMSYSHNDTPTSEQNKEKEVIGAGRGYMQANDTNTSSEQDKPTRGKGRGKKPKVEQPTLLDTNKKGVAYNDDEQRVFDWYSHLDFNRVAPEQTPTRKQHSATLVPHVHSQEEMQSLADFTKESLAKRGIKVYVVEMGNMTNSKNLNEWLAQRNQVKPSAPQPDTYSSTPEVDLNKPVVWTRYKHQGAAKDHWYLYAVMPLSEALQYGYKADMIPPNDRGSIRTMLKSLAEGRRELTPEQKSEVETAELRLHLVA